MVVRIGTSGWSYDHWHPELYPPGLPARDRLLDPQPTRHGPQADVGLGQHRSSHHDAAPTGTPPRPRPAHTRPPDPGHSISVAARCALSRWPGHSRGAEASFDSGDEFLRNRIQRRGSWPLSAGAHGPRGHAHRLVCYGVAAEQPGIGDVPDMVHRATERSSVVPGLAGRGLDRGGADLRLRRVVPVNVPGHGVHVQALLSR